MIKIGIIGLGKMGGYHATACQSITNVDLVAIADTHKQNWRKIKSSKIIKTKEFQEWLNFVDAVIIAVPTEFHFKIAKTCLEAGKHVLLEKPLTKTLKQAEDLFAIAHAQNRCLHVGHVERFNGAVQELKKIVNQPYLIECHRIGPFTPRPQKDSVVLDLMIHDLDIILNLVNSPIKSVSMIGNSLKTENGDVAIVQLKFENGVLANIVSSRVAQIKKRTMSIHQPDCFIKLDFATQDIEIHRHTSHSVKVAHKALKYKQEGTVKHLFVYKENPLKLEIEHFIRSIKLGSKSINAQQDMIALKLALQIEQQFSS